ncbi:MAG: DUF1499 domain-containing protein [Geminicoccaceae bacterium]
MIGLRRSTTIVLGTLMLFSLFGCGAKEPVGLGLGEEGLSPCPDRPNCVASNTEDEAQQIEPFHFTDQAAAWTALKKAVADLPRTNVVTADDTYLHAEARSRIFGFVDDLEFQMRAEENVIALRSAARTGYSDFGVNAERLETLRARLQAEGVLP